MCDKLKYMTKETAMLKLELIELRRGKFGRKYKARRQESRAYLCPICGFWHLTKRGEK